ncbi:hypothetical protein ACSUZJ_05765 [Telluria sp. B2]
MPIILQVSDAQNKKGITISHDAFIATTKFVVGRAGFEPATNGLKVPETAAIAS